MPPSSLPTLPNLDDKLYPQSWQNQTVTTPTELLMAMLSGKIDIDADNFAEWLLADKTYQDWINFTVFGSYIQRSFTAFYQQSEDSFNQDLPAIFYRELKRHAQYLPLNQTLFFAGNLPKAARQNKLLFTTLNPATAILNAQKIKQGAAPVIINQIKVTGKSVAAFAVRHNKRTRERLKSQVLILDFQQLRLIKDEIIEADLTYCLKTYEIK